MAYFAGLDVSVKETRVCIVDDAGKIVREARVASEPEALLQVLTIYRFKRVGLEAGPLSQWLYSVLAEAGLPVICVETRHMRAMLKAQINKTDRNDARGIAQMMRVGLYRPVHVKTLRSQKTAHAADPSQAAAVEGHRHRERPARHPPHPHANMEIITYVREGAVTHKDSLSNEGRTEAGDVQVMSAGAGIRHAEYNLAWHCRFRESFSVADLSRRARACRESPNC